MKEKAQRTMALTVVLAVILTSGAANADLVAHWKLDETSGTTAHDSSGNNHEGKLQEGLSFENNSVIGVMGNALSIDGSDGRIHVDSIFLPVDGFTISLWFNPDSDLDSSSGREDLMFWGGPAMPQESDKPFLTINNDEDKEDGTIYLGLSIVGEGQQYLGTTTDSWKAATWHHVAVTYDGWAAKIYVNGILENVAELPGTHYASSKVWFGGKYLGTGSLHGRLDDIRIYDNALTEEMIAFLHKPDPVLQELISAAEEAEAIKEQEPKKAVAFIEKRITESEQWKEQHPNEHVSLYKAFSFDLHFLLAKARSRAGLPQKDIKAAYERAAEEWIPSFSSLSSALLWLHENTGPQEYSRVLQTLTKNRADCLTAAASKAEEMIAEQKAEAAVKFLEENLAAYSQWCSTSGSESKLKGLPAVYFQLARAREAAGAGKKDIVDAYTGTCGSWEPDHLREQTAALVWLLKNGHTEKCGELIKSATLTGEVDGQFANVAGSVAADFELKKDWRGFEQFLDILFAQAKYPYIWAVFLESCLGDPTNQWGRDYLNYLDGRAGVRFGRDWIAAHKCAGDGDFRKAAELYRNMAERCGAGDNKGLFEFELSKCLFSGGEYHKALSRLESFITKYKTTHKDLVKEAMSMKGRAHVQVGEPEKAVDSFSALMKEFPATKDMPEAGFFLGYCHMKLGHFEKAIQMLTAVAQDHPRSGYSGKACLCLSHIEKKTK